MEFTPEQVRKAAEQTIKLLESKRLRFVISYNRVHEEKLKKNEMGFFNMAATWHSFDFFNMAATWHSFESGTIACIGGWMLQMLDADKKTTSLYDLQRAFPHGSKEGNGLYHLMFSWGLVDTKDSGSAANITPTIAAKATRIWLDGSYEENPWENIKV